MTQVILFAFTGLLVIAAVGDWRRYLIPNWISLAILALYPPFVLSSNLLGSPSVAVPWLASLGVAAIVFVVLAILFAMNKLGGGDVKLISALSLWAGPGLLAGFLVITSLAGGVLALVFLLRSRMRKKATSGDIEADRAGPDTKKQDHDDDTTGETTAGAEIEPLQIPYGVAIACGGIFISGKHIINHFSQ
ncbi:MAG: prepilin peptidase [Proteobacteria bacterium]|nr:prepilin peptidase [Pseudomonadota bacterium]